MAATPVRTSRGNTSTTELTPQLNHNLLQVLAALPTTGEVSLVVISSAEPRRKRTLRVASRSLVGTHSTDPAESLVSLLIDEGRLDPDLAKPIGEAAAAQNRPLDALLVAEQLISPADMAKLAHGNAEKLLKLT